MGRLDDLLKKAKSVGVEEEHDFFEDGIKFMEDVHALRDKIGDLQKDERLLEPLGNYFRGVIITVYRSPDREHEGDQIQISIMYDMLERSKPYIHFLLGSPFETPVQINTDRNGKYPELKRIVEECPELTPEVLEENLCTALDKKIS